MENKINIAELLKDCPQGMELDCTMYENVYFDKTYNEEDCLYPIGCYIIGDNNRNSVNFTKYGEFNYHSNAKCIIFPKGKTTWEGFQRPFRDGDIVVGKNCACSYITIFREFINNTSFSHHVCLTSFGKINVDDISDNANLRFATEEEKQKLFDAIKAEGYHWNSETKTLDKLVEPKFKVGDKIVKLNSVSNSWIVSSVSSEYYGLKLPKGIEGIGVLPVSEQDDCELLSDIRPKFKIGDTIQDEDEYKVKITEVNLEDKCYGYESIIAKGIGSIAFSEQNNWKLILNIEPKFKVGDRVCNKNYKDYIYTIHDIVDKGYSAKEINADSPIIILFGSQEDNYELVPNKFDITTLKPFDKVLIRDTDTQIWFASLFSHCNGLDFYKYKCINSCGYAQCIPYKSNEYLLGKTEDCDEYYKNW